MLDVIEAVDKAPDWLIAESLSSTSTASSSGSGTCHIIELRWVASGRGGSFLRTCSPGGLEGPGVGETGAARGGGPVTG